MVQVARSNLVDGLDVADDLEPLLDFLFCREGQTLGEILLNWLRAVFQEQAFHRCQHIDEPVTVVGFQRAVPVYEALLKRACCS
jgi:hypothetical protein